MGVVVNGDEESKEETAGEEAGVNEELRLGHVGGREGKEHPPSSIEGELDILSIMSSSMSASSSSPSSTPEAPPLLLSAWSSRMSPLTLFTTVRSSSEPGSSRKVLASLQAPF